MAGKRSRKALSKAKPILAQAVREIAAHRVARLPVGYPAFLKELKARIHSAQVRAALAVNRELIQLYWSIGRDIVHRQQTDGWGGAVIEQLATDLGSAFPTTTGFSPSNLWRMRAFYMAYQCADPILAQPVRELADGAKRAQAARDLDAANLPQAVREIPWGHNVELLHKLKDFAERLWYAQQTIANGWSRAMLVHWIESDLYARQGKAITNFKSALPPAQSDLATQILKCPYNFGFLMLPTDAAERDLECGLLDHIRKFLLELGAGFSFVGQQMPLEVDGEDFSIDLLFYHLRLRCYVVIDLKVKAFKPEFAGKMNFYFSAVDDLLRHPDDKPSIGLILCKTRSKIIAEYALRDSAKPVGVSQYNTKLVESLPAGLKKALPSTKALEAELRQRNTRVPEDGS